MPHPKPHQTEGEGGAVPEILFSREWDEWAERMRRLEFQQRRPYQEDGHLAADDWWHRNSEGTP